MKKIRTSFVLLTLFITAVAGTLIGIGVWANKPKGVHITLSD